MVETFKNYRSTFDDVTDDVILRNVGGLIGDVIPLNLTDRLYIIISPVYTIQFNGARHGAEPGLV